MDFFEVLISCILIILALNLLTALAESPLLMTLAAVIDFLRIKSSLILLFRLCLDKLEDDSCFKLGFFFKNTGFKNIDMLCSLKFCLKSGTQFVDIVFGNRFVYFG